MIKVPVANPEFWLTSIKWMLTMCYLTFDRVTLVLPCRWTIGIHNWKIHQRLFFFRKECYCASDRTHWKSTDTTNPRLLLCSSPRSHRWQLLPKCIAFLSVRQIFDQTITRTRRRNEIQSKFKFNHCQTWAPFNKRTAPAWVNSPLYFSSVCQTLLRYRERFIVTQHRFEFDLSLALMPLRWRWRWIWDESSLVEINSGRWAWDCIHANSTQCRLLLSDSRLQRA